MNTIGKGAQLCVLRDLGNGDVQYVPVDETNSVEAGDRAFIGMFTPQTERHGPSGSHVRTVCIPRGELHEITIPVTAINTRGKFTRPYAVACVVREVRPGDSQYRPLDSVDVVTAGEPVYVGIFALHWERNGPYGSHQMLIGQPCSRLIKVTLQA